MMRDRKGIKKGEVRMQALTFRNRVKHLPGLQERKESTEEVSMTQLGLPPVQSQTG